MKIRATLGVMAALVLCSLSERTAAGDIKELARFKAPDREVEWIALSADGTRLAAALSRAEPGKQYLSEAVIWDVDTGAKVSTKERPNSRFYYVFFSADGKTFVTVDNDTQDLRVRGMYGYQTWDAATGKEIGSAITPAPRGELTTLAISPDGKYLATVFNASTRPFLVRQLDVWDVKAHKVKWEVPGVAHTGRLHWSDSVAFSPDSKKLIFALSGPGGPSSESHPDQPDVNLTRLKMVALEEGKEAAVTGLETKNPIEGSLEWTSGGRLFVERDGRMFTTYDSATGRLKDSFVLNFSPSDPPIVRVPDGWREGGSVLSTDGSRLAAHFYRDFDLDFSKAWQNRVFIWDVPNRKVLGAVVLPDAGPAPGGVVYERAGIRIALSENGDRLAIREPRGAIGVYDVSKISGLMNATPGESTAKEPGAAKVGDAAEVRKAYEAAVLKARERLLARFDEVIAWSEKNDKVKAGAVARLKDQRDLFDKRDLVPWSEAMWKDTGRYLKAVGDARAKALADAGAGDLPADLRDRIDGRVVARWVHQPGDGKLTLYSSGRINAPDGENAWSFSGGRLMLRWKNDQAPGGFWVDTCVLAPDGQSYSGENQIKTKVSGKLVTEE